LGSALQGISRGRWRRARFAGFDQTRYRFRHHGVVRQNRFTGEYLLRFVRAMRQWHRGKIRTSTSPNLSSPASMRTLRACEVKGTQLPGTIALLQARRRRV
jgi:hypothetical protein